MTTRLALSALALSCLAAAPLASQERGGFLVRLGTDTVGIETFTRTASRLEVDLMWRAPRTTLRHYVLDLAADGSVTRAEVAVYRPGAPSGRPMQGVIATFRGDSATWESRRGDSVTTRTVAAPAGTLPLLFPAYSTLTLVTERARRAGQDSVSVMMQPGPGQAYPVAVQVLGSDSMTIQLPTGQVRAGVDRAGHFLGAIAPEATAHHVVTPVAGVDVRAVALAFAARDSAGQAMGVLSPRDTIRTVIAGASLMVDYGRPLKRGREIFGGIVPWDRVWRTGANAATQFKTDRDLVIGGVTVPAGMYTLWSVPRQAGWKLVINRQTGQWGTEYHADQDLARIDMRTEPLASPVEQFTITAVPDGRGGALHFAWDRTQAYVPFTVR